MKKTCHVPPSVPSWPASACLVEVYEQVMTKINDLCPTYEWVMSHIRISHVTHVNESCHLQPSLCFTCRWLLGWHIWMVFVPYMNESRPTNDWVRSHVRMGWVMFLTRMSDFQRMYESCHTQPWIPSTYRWLLGWHGVATISRLLKITSLFCRVLSLL